VDRWGGEKRAKGRCNSTGSAPRHLNSDPGNPGTPPRSIQKSFPNASSNTLLPTTPPHTMAVPDYYAILALPAPHDAAPALSAADLKLAYHRALLHHHPDKTGPTATASSTTAPSIDDIRAAYTTLATPARKRAYDARLLHARRAAAAPRATAAAAEAVDLDDLRWDAARGAWVRGCARCGGGGDEDADADAAGGFVVTEEMLEEVLEAQAREERAETGSQGAGGVDAGRAPAGGEVLVQCASCSLWIRVVFAVAEDDDEEG
jgi:diphthamide biosynthesis protein 4